MLGVIAALAIPADTFAVTDDTEVFVNPYITAPAKPNVLFIIDNSGSMDELTAGAGSQTRLEAIKASMNNILRNETIKKSINAGLMRFTGTGGDNQPPAAQRQALYYPIAPLDADASTVDTGPTTLATPLATAEATPSVRTRLLNIVDSMRAGGSTPIPGTMYEAARYLAGLSVGFTSTTPNNSSFGRFGVSHRAALSGGTLGRCATFNGSGGCATAVTTPCTSGTADMTRDNVTGTVDTTSCNFITGSATYISPLTEDRGAPFAALNANSTQAEKDAQKCRVADYIIFLTDGLPTQNNSTLVNDVQTLIGKNCASRVGGDGTCAKEIAEYLHNPPGGDLRPGQGNLGPTGTSQQWVITHTIAFALNDTAGQTYLQEIATAGGGNLYLANDQATLTAVLESIFTNVLPKQNAGFAAPRFSTQAFSRLYSGDDVYVSLFVPSERSRWRGNVKKYKACTDLHPNWNSTTKTCNTANGNFAFGTILDKNNNTLVDPASGKIRLSAVDLWSTTSNDGDDVEKGGAGAQLLNKVTTNAASRVLYTFNGTYDATIPSKVSTLGDLTNTANLLTTANTALTDTMFGAPKDPVITWIRNRTDVPDENGNNNTTEVIWPFDDPMHASAVPIEFGLSAGTSITKLFVPNNGGGLRMLNATTGAEEWMFIPRELLPLQTQIMTNPKFLLPNTTRLYGLDGTPTVWSLDQNNNGIVTDSGDFVRLVFGQRDGGRRYYAVDVTPKGGAASPDPTPTLLWTIDPATDPNYADLANSWSRPTFGRLLIGGSVKDVLFIGGGNDTTLNDNVGPQLAGSRKGNAVFVVDASTGERLALIGGNTTTTTTDPVTGVTTTTQTSAITGFDFPIPGNITAFDSNGDGFTDRLYYADLGGNVWRTDLVVGTSSVTGNDTTRRIADLAANNATSPAALIPLQNGDSAATPPITASATTDYRAFYFAPEVVRLDSPRFGGRFDLVIIGAGHVAHPLDLTVHNAIYAIKDKNISPYTSSSTVTAVTDRCTTALTAATNCLADLSGNPLQRDSTGSYVNATTTTTAMENTLRFGAGWVIDLADKGATAGTFVWRGEKAYSQPVVIGGKLFYTTYIPPTIEQMRSASLPGQCGIAEGVGRIYARDLLTGSAVFAKWNDQDTTKNADNSDALTDKDTFRETGGLPPSEIGLGVRPDDIIVAAQSPLEGSPAGTGLPRRRIYWQER